jgi:hypothetical protein
MIRACEGLSLGLELYNVGCFGALGRVDNVELHLLAFSQRLKAAVLNIAKMNEHIAAIFTGNESKAFGIIEPFYGTCLHDELPPSCEIEATEKDEKKPQSLSVFAVSLQEHPELLAHIFHLLPRNVNGYYCPGDNIFGHGRVWSGKPLQMTAKHV